MKRLPFFFCFVLVLVAAGLVRGEEPKAPPKAKPAPPAGMTRYVFGLIKKGPAWTPGPSAEIQKIQEGHMANIERLAKEGKLVLAGPFEGGNDLRGLFVFKVETLEEARALTETDPAVKAGRLQVDLTYWWGPVVLQEVQKLWEASQKK